MTPYILLAISGLMLGQVIEWVMPDAPRLRRFAVMALAQQHTFQILTKRADRMRLYLDRASGRIADTIVHMRRNRGDRNLRIGPLAHLPPGARWWPLPNVWLGVSVEDQRRANDRIPDLLAIPAAVRWISAEPLLGAIDLVNITGGTATSSRLAVNALTGSIYRPDKGARAPGPRLDWVVAGGESGPGARPMHPDWARQLRNQCAGAGVPFFFKQWGEWKCALDRDRDDPDWRADYGNDYVDHGKSRWLNLAGGRGFHGDRFVVMRRCGKKAAGRRLDGVIHDARPQTTGAAS